MKRASPSFRRWEDCRIDHLQFVAELQQFVALLGVRSQCVSKSCDLLSSILALFGFETFIVAGPHQASIFFFLAFAVFNIYDYFVLYVYH